MSEPPLPWLAEPAARLSDMAARLPHALLVSGQPGIGKRILAEAFVARLLCEKDRAGRGPACGDCTGCRLLAAQNHPDVRWLEPESRQSAHPQAEEAARSDSKAARTRRPSEEIRIEQVRELDGFLSHGSHRGGRRIVVIDPAEAMNRSAANALLKSLEEPAGEAMFIVICDQPGRLLPTIRSRTVQFHLATPAAAVAEAWLTENGVESPERWLAFSGGSPLVAKGLFEDEPMRKLVASIEPPYLHGGRERFDSLLDGPISGAAAVEARLDLMQRWVLDQAFLKLCGRSRYGFGEGETRQTAASMLRAARALGKARPLARHPLNPGLFLESCLSLLDGKSAGDESNEKY